MDSDSQSGLCKIVIIGSGNVATHLARALDAKADVVQVMSRSVDNALTLSSQLHGCQATDRLSALRTDADFYILAVNDDALADMAKNMPKVKGVVMHTSGSTPMQVLEGASERIGVFYPLQTFSKHAQVRVEEVPFFIEASDDNTFTEISNLASLISKFVYQADSSSRKALHIAAVFACNFFNHLLSISSEILAEHDYKLDVLKPLLELTLDKALAIGPDQAQTGPAARRDVKVMEAHIASLDSHKREIYRILSDSIMNNIKK